MAIFPKPTHLHGTRPEPVLVNLNNPICGYGPPGYIGSINVYNYELWYSALWNRFISLVENLRQIATIVQKGWTTPIFQKTKRHQPQDSGWVWHCRAAGYRGREKDTAVNKKIHYFPPFTQLATSRRARLTHQERNTRISFPANTDVVQSNLVVL